MYREMRTQRGNQFISIINSGVGSDDKVSSVV
jgi:hypothetical protein